MSIIKYVNKILIIIFSLLFNVISTVIIYRKFWIKKVKFVLIFDFFNFNIIKLILLILKISFQLIILNLIFKIRISSLNLIIKVIFILLIKILDNRFWDEHFPFQLYFLKFYFLFLVILRRIQILKYRLWFSTLHLALF